MDFQWSETDFQKTHSTLEPSLLVDEVVEIMLICEWSFYILFNIQFRVSDFL